jgi:hypothetical protein
LVEHEIRDAIVRELFLAMPSTDVSPVQLDLKLLDAKVTQCVPSLAHSLVDGLLM